MKFYCSANEFYTGKAYTSFTGTGTMQKSINLIKKRTHRKSLYAIIAILPIAVTHLYVSNMTPTIEQSMAIYFLNFAMIVITLYGILNLFDTSKNIKDFQKKLLIAPKHLNENILIYEVRKAGIYYNAYNKINVEDMLYIPWSKISKCTIDDLKITSDPDESISKIENKGVTIHTYTNHKNHIPIPTRWLHNGEYEIFLKHLAKHTTIVDKDREMIPLSDLFEK